METSTPSPSPSSFFCLKTYMRGLLRPRCGPSKWDVLASSARRDGLKPRSLSHRVRPIVLRSQDGARLSGWLMTPRWPEVKGAVLYFSNGTEEALWLAGQAQTMFPGMTILVMRYRAPSGRARHPAVEQMVADGESLFDWLTEAHQHLPDFPVVVMGRDFGAGVAVKVAASRPAAALAFLTPCDARQAGRSGRFTLLRRGAMLAREPAFLLKQSCPVLILRVPADAIVSPASTDAFVARLPVRTQEKTITGADHHDLPYRQEVHRAVAAFLGEHLPAKVTGMRANAVTNDSRLILAA